MIEGSDSDSHMPSSRSLLKGKTPPTWLVLCGPITCNIGFGLYPVVVKFFASGEEEEEGEKANSFIFTLYRGAFATPVLFLVSYFCEGRILIPDVRATVAFMLIALFGVLIGQPMIAVWTAVISVLCGVEKVPSLKMYHTYAKLFGVLISLGGVANIFSGSPPGNDKGRQVLGFLVLLVDTFCGGVFITLQKKLIYNKPDCVWKSYPIAITAYVYLFGSIFQAVANVYFIFTGQTHLFMLPRHALPALVYAVFITSALCYSILFWTNKYLPPSVTTAFWPVQTVSTVFTAYFILGDELTFRQCIGAVSILVGLALVLYSNHVDEQLAKEAAVSGSARSNSNTQD